MRLRTIFFILASLAFLSSALGGYFYYSNVKLALTGLADKQADYKIAESKSRFASFFSEQLKPVRTLAGLAAVQYVLEKPSSENINKANTILELFKITLEADVCYLMDATGVTIASSNHLEPDSFVGISFAFRPYFKQAIRGTSAMYMALGATSGKRGVYYSFPVLDREGLQTNGVAVIKASVENIENELIRSVSENETLLLADPHGIIFIASNESLLFQSLWKLSAHDMETVASSRQFGAGPWQDLGFTKISHSNRVTDKNGREMILYGQSIAAFPGWQIIYLRDLPSAHSAILTPFQNAAGLLILLFFISVITGVCVLYRNALQEIMHRKEVERALVKSEKRYRNLYLNTPALLHSIDQRGKLVNVSDYWTEVLGYDREEVVGLKVTEFMTEQSREYADKKVIPQFFKTGFCRDIKYQFVKKNGEIIDVLLSAIAEYDELGGILRSIAILVDITELKLAEKKLKKATEELGRYSQELERQVRERTGEISNILKYTPAIIYLKDTKGRYMLVNSRFESLFGTSLEEIRGKRDGDIFGRDMAVQFEQNDQRVLDGKVPLHVEEKIRLDDGEHAYISVKFPLFDNNNIIGLGGISTDITDLKNAQEKLKQLSNRIITGQEKERSAIARELHDELGQALTALRMEAAWLEKKLHSWRDDVAARAGAMSELIDKTIDEVRNMAVRLRPGVLDDLGLIAALEWLVDDFEKRYAVSCTFRHQNVPDLNKMAATAIYRITQEALTNVARHANAASVEVCLVAENNKMVLSIKDDGQGFNSEDSEESEGLGLSGIKERASLIDASVSIESNPGTGSLIRIHFEMEGFSKAKETCWE